MLYAQLGTQLNTKLNAQLRKRGQPAVQTAAELAKATVSSFRGGGGRENTKASRSSFEESIWRRSWQDLDLNYIWFELDS